MLWGPHVSQEPDRHHPRNSAADSHNDGYVSSGSPARAWWCTPVALVGHMPAQHSTAQHSTAQHSTAQHSTAQHSIPICSACSACAARTLLCKMCAAHSLLCQVERLARDGWSHPRLVAILAPSPAPRVPQRPVGAGVPTGMWHTVTPGSGRAAPLGGGHAQGWNAIEPELPDQEGTLLCWDASLVPGRPNSAATASAAGATLALLDVPARLAWLDFQGLHVRQREKCHV
jgi:hypothetical protein